MNFIPINPLRMNDGNLLSLATLRGSLNAQPIPLDPGTKIKNVIVSFGGQEISVSLSASLGIGTIFSGSVKISEAGYWLDAFASADSERQTTETNIVNKTRWGYGLRIMFRAQQLDSSFKLTFAAIGAAVELGFATASYEVQTIGLGPLALSAILDGLSQFGAINGQTFHELNTTVLKNLKALVTQPPAEFDVRPLAVQVKFPLELDPIVKARSEVFAIRRIREGTDLKNALARAGTSRNADAIRAVYRRVVGDVSETQPPSQSAREFAKAWGE